MFSIHNYAIEYQHVWCDDTRFLKLISINTACIEHIFCLQIVAVAGMAGGVASEPGRRSVAGALEVNVVTT